MKKKTGIVLLVLGVVCIALSLSLLAYNKAQDKRAGDTADKILAEVQDEIKNSELPVRAGWNFDS